MQTVLTWVTSGLAVAGVTVILVASWRIVQTLTRRSSGGGRRRR